MGMFDSLIQEHWDNMRTYGRSEVDPPLDVKKHEREKVELAKEKLKQGWEAMFNKNCIHKDDLDFDWQDCDDCVLKILPWKHRDLCFFVWHEHITKQDIQVQTEER